MDAIQEVVRPRKQALESLELDVLVSKKYGTVIFVEQQRPKRPVKRVRKRQTLKRMLCFSLFSLFVIWIVFEASYKTERWREAFSSVKPRLTSNLANTSQFEV